MGQNVNYDANGIIQSKTSFAVISPKIYVDSRNFYWRHLDMDVIEESLGIFIERIQHLNCVEY